MDHEQHTGVIEREVAALSRAARGHLNAPVPSCPRWTVARLLVHVGSAHRMAALALGREGGDASFFADVPRLADDGDPVAWLDDGASALVAALRSAAPDAPAFTFFEPPHAEFWSRRMAHETAAHRWDVEAAVGQPAPIDGDLAADGIEELLAMFAARPADRAPRPSGAGETIHLHCTDRDGEWVIGLEPDGFSVRHEHAKSDVAARGAASDLLLLLLGRVGPDAVDVFGDVALLARWQEIAKF